MKDLELPYFDQVLKQLTAGDEAYEQAWGRHVHWGYWAKPKKADGSVEDFSLAADEFCRQHFEIAQLENGLEILDVGCGFGGNIELINKTFDDVRLFGVNIDARQIERATALVVPQTKDGNAIEFVVGNAVDLPYEDNSFDVVFALECIFHFPSREEFLSEAFRVLKPGGKLVFSDFVGAQLAMPFLQVGAALTKKATSKTLGPVLPFESMSGYDKLASSAGFTPLASKDITKNVIPSIPVYKKLLASGDEFVTQMFKTQSRVSDSMKWNLVRFMILSFKKPE